MKISRANIKTIEGLIEEGIKALNNGNTARACDVWFEAWQILKSMPLKSFEDVKLHIGDHILEWMGFFAVAIYEAGKSNSEYYQKGLQYLKEVIEKFEEDDVLRWFKKQQADMLFITGNIDECLKIYEELIVHDEALFYMGYGDILREMGEKEKAVEMYLKAYDVADESYAETAYERLKEVCEEADSLIMDNKKIEKYKAYRKALRDVCDRVFEKVDRDVFIESARMLGIEMKDTIVVRDDSEAAYLHEFIVYEYKIDGKSLIEIYGKAENEIEEEIIAGVRQSYTSLFRIKSISRLKHELELEDLLNGNILRGINIGFSKSLNRNMLLFARIIPLRDFNMVEGGFVFDTKHEKQILKKYKKLMKKLRYDEPTSRFIAFFKINRIRGLEVEFVDVEELT